MANKLWKVHCISHNTDDDLHRCRRSFLYITALYSSSRLWRNCCVCLLRWIPLCMIVNKMSVARRPWSSSTETHNTFFFLRTEKYCIIKTPTVAAVKICLDHLTILVNSDQTFAKSTAKKSLLMNECFCDLYVNKCLKNICLETRNNI